MAEPERIGVRELRQNASVYLRAVRAGSSFAVTSHGEPVALLVPVPQDDLERLYAEGTLLRPVSSSTWQEVRPAAAAAEQGQSLSDLLADLRRDER